MAPSPSSPIQAPSPGVFVNTQKLNNGADEKTSVLFFIMGFLVPLAGFFMYFLHKEHAPGKARGALNGGLFQVGVSLIYVIAQVALGNPIELRARRSTTKPVVVAILPKTQDLEAKAVTAINEQLATQQVAFTCTSVSLVRESAQKYTGTAQFSDGTTGSVVMDIDEAHSTSTVKVVQH